MTKIIEGEPYSQWMEYTNKSDADKEAEKLRKAGKRKTRVHHEKTLTSLGKKIYVVWVGARRKL